MLSTTREQRDKKATALASAAAAAALEMGADEDNPTLVPPNTPTQIASTSTHASETPAQSEIANVYAGLNCMQILDHLLGMPWANALPASFKVAAAAAVAAFITSPTTSAPANSGSQPRKRNEKLKQKVCSFKKNNFCLGKKLLTSPSRIDFMIVTSMWCLFLPCNAVRP
jgi:hypothetical protein